MAGDASSMIQCSMCGARVREGETECAICGACVQVVETARLLAQLPHWLLNASIIALVVIGSIWFFSPATESALAPTETPTITPWPTSTYTDTATPTLSPTITPSLTATAFCVPHSVMRSENLEIIAEKYGVSPNEIRLMNKLDSLEPVRPGQRLCIPVLQSSLASLTPAPTRTPTPLIYTVERGDNLGSIAQQFGSTVQLLVEANELDPDEMLSVGQSLLVPRIFDTPTPVTPTLTRTPTAPPPTMTDTPTATPKPFAYMAPALLYPLEGADFHGADAAIVLNWSAVTLLQADEWYILNVYYIVEGERYRVAQVRTKDTSWRLPPSAYVYQEGFYELEWSVITVRALDTGEVLRISPPSATRRFLWY